MPLLNQLVGVFLVEPAALGLAVRAVRTTHIRTFIPLNAKPAQGIEDLLFGLAAGAQLVGVFNAQDELAAMLAGKHHVEQGDIGRANVGITGGRRRDAGTNNLGHVGVPESGERNEVGHSSKNRVHFPAVHAAGKLPRETGSRAVA